MVGLFQLLGRLPLPLLQAIGAMLGRMVFVLSGAYRRKVLANLAAGLTPLEIVRSYPSVKPEAVLAALAYAADLAQERILRLPA